MSRASALGADGLELLRNEPSGATTAFVAEPDDPVLIGHYPGFPVQPGVFLVEAADRTVRLWADGAGLGAGLELVAMDRCRFRRPVFPGDRVSTEVTVDAGEDGGLLTAKASALTVSGAVADIRLRYRRTSAATTPTPEGEAQ
ncbi:3-hydroxyacyl-ACP dehydratase FabZ family protein [Streptomyces sp. NPDC058812]|uniref:3-hydroxyacyl-ACP dehydratase FabZ family protein n=1 Tax=unclassified Streptomyces TaxID=2593676 RepID=UPI0036833726